MVLEYIRISQVPCISTQSSDQKLVPLSEQPPLFDSDNNFIFQFTLSLYQCLIILRLSLINISLC